MSASPAAEASSDTEGTATKSRFFVDDEPVLRVRMRYRRESEVVHQISNEIDPMWAHVDPAGHFHAVAGDLTAPPWPTLRWVPEPCTLGHDECDAEGHHECKVCGDLIEPGTRAPRPLTIQTSPWWEVTVEDPRLDLERGQLVSFHVRQPSKELFGFLEVTEVISGPVGRRSWVLVGDLYAQADKETRR